MALKVESVLILICSVIVLSVSGCTIPGPSASTGAGVIITDFTTEFSEYYLKEPVMFKVKIRNTGSVDAENININLLNLDGWTEVDAGECRISKLMAPNPDMGTSGEIHICTFKYKAPDNLPQGLSFTYHPIARMSYEYGSSTIESITIAPRAELRRIQDTGTALPAETVSTGQGPVLLSIETKGPIKFWEDSSSVIFPIEIKATNVGKGRSSYGDNPNELGVKITLPIGLDANSDCAISSSFTKGTLWQGKTYESICKITAIGSSESPVQKVIRVDAKYKYSVDMQATVRVKWREHA
jgi:hypothetical protein